MRAIEPSLGNIVLLGIVEINQFFCPVGILPYPGLEPLVHVLGDFVRPSSRWNIEIGLLVYGVSLCDSNRL
jgi:hypothetical protein